MFSRVLAGGYGAIRDAVLLNAGAGIAVHEAGAGTLVEQLARGVERARESIDSGAAQEVLARWIEATSSGPG